MQRNQAEGNIADANKQTTRQGGDGLEQIAQIADRPAQTLTREEFDSRKKGDKKLQQALADRDARIKGDPNAKLADNVQAQVTPRYRLVQNRSDEFLIVPDLKTNDEDLGLVLQPGEALLLTDFYTPMEINRSKGLRWAVQQPGYGRDPKTGLENMLLVPLANEEEADDFVAPVEKDERGRVVKPQLPQGHTIVEYVPYRAENEGKVPASQRHNPFDDAMEETLIKDEKRDDKLKMKILGERRSRQHGSVSHV